MQKKRIIFDSEVRESIQKGINKLADAVKITLGPNGKTVGYTDSAGVDRTTKDGVTVSEQIFVSNPYENHAIQVLKGASKKTADLAGDGTTTSMVLAQSIFNEGLEYKDLNTNLLRKGIDKAVQCVVESIKEQAVHTTDPLILRQVAEISSNGDSEITEIVCKTFEAVGLDGREIIQNSFSSETKVEIVSGIQFVGGYASPYFITDTEKKTVEYENPYILLCNKPVRLFREFQKLVEECISKKRPLVIIGNEIEAEALNTLAVNKVHKGFSFAVIKLYAQGDFKKPLMEDIALTTGATLFDTGLGRDLGSCGIEILGSADKIIATDQYCTIIGQKGDKVKIKAQVDFLKSKYAEVPANEYKHRIAYLTSGIATIYVGAPTEQEAQEKRDRMDDAMRAVRSAAEEGIVPGGGVAYLRAIRSLDALVYKSEEDRAGRDIIKKALEEPMRTILNNAGFDADKIVNRVLAQNSVIDQKRVGPDYGFNALDGCYGSMYDMGIIDPAKVSRLAIENAASVASLLLTTGCLIVPE